MIPQLFERRGIEYRWAVLAVAFLTVFTVLGFRHAFGVMYVAILDDTGWMRGDTAGIFSLAMITYMLTAVASGALFDWVGPRVQFPIGALVMAAGLLLCGTIGAIWELYVYYGILVGLGFVLLGFVPHMALVPQWFPRRTGLASAAIISGLGVGSLGMAMLCTWSILWLGWRGTFVLVAGILALGIFPLTLLLHRNPAAHQKIATAPDTLGAIAEADTPIPANTTLRSAMAHPAFWLLLVAVTLIGAGQMTMAVHQTRLLVDLGYPIALAAMLFGLTGLFRSAGGLLWGPLSDRYGTRGIVLLAGGMGALGVVALLLVRDASSLTTPIVFVVLFGIGFGGISPVYASIVSQLFPGRSLGKIFGLLDMGYGAGSAGGPFLAGWVFDRLGTYDPALYAVGTAAGGSGLFMYLALQSHRRFPAVDGKTGMPSASNGS